MCLDSVPDPVPDCWYRSVAVDSVAGFENCFEQLVVVVVVEGFVEGIQQVAAVRRPSFDVATE